MQDDTWIFLRRCLFLLAVCFSLDACAPEPYLRSTYLSLPISGEEVETRYRLDPEKKYMLRISSPHSLTDLKRDLDNGWQLIFLDELPVTLHDFKRGATGDINHLYFVVGGTGLRLSISIRTAHRPYQLGPHLDAKIYEHRWFQNLDATGFDWTWLFWGAVILVAFVVLMCIAGAMTGEASEPREAAPVPDARAMIQERALALAIEADLESHFLDKQYQENVAWRYRDGGPFAPSSARGLPREKWRKQYFAVMQDPDLLSILEAHYPHVLEILKAKVRIIQLADKKAVQPKRRRVLTSEEKNRFAASHYHAEAFLRGYRTEEEVIDIEEALRDEIINHPTWSDAQKKVRLERLDAVIAARLAQPSPEAESAEEDEVGPELL
jgi:hypothetical protein